MNEWFKYVLIRSLHEVLATIWIHVAILLLNLTLIKRHAQRTDGLSHRSDGIIRLVVKSLILLELSDFHRMVLHHLQIHRRASLKTLRSLVDMPHDHVARHPRERLLQNWILGVNSTLISVLLVERRFKRLTTQWNIIVIHKALDPILVLLNDSRLLEFLSTLNHVLQHEWREQSLRFVFFLILLESLVQVLVDLEAVWRHLLMTRCWLNALKDFLPHFLIVHLLFGLARRILGNFSFSSSHLQISTKYSRLISDLIRVILMCNVGKYRSINMVSLSFFEVIQALDHALVCIFLLVKKHAGRSHDLNRLIHLGNFIHLTRGLNLKRFGDHLWLLLHLRNLVKVIDGHGNLSHPLQVAGVLHVHLLLIARILFKAQRKPFDWLLQVLIFTLLNRVVSEVLPMIDHAELFGQLSVGVFIFARWHIHHT